MITVLKYRALTQIVFYRQRFVSHPGGAVSARLKLNVKLPIAQYPFKNPVVQPSSCLVFLLEPAVLKLPEVLNHLWFVEFHAVFSNSEKYIYRLLFKHICSLPYQFIHIFISFYATVSPNPVQTSVESMYMMQTLYIYIQLLTFFDSKRRNPNHSVSITPVHNPQTKSQVSEFSILKTFVRLLRRTVKLQDKADDQ